MHNSYSQPNVLSQLMNMSLQMNLMKLLNQETTTSTHTDNSQLQTLALLSSLGGLGGLGGAQTFKSSNLPLSSLDLFSQLAQGAGSQIELVSPNATKHSSLNTASLFKKNNLTGNRDLKSLMLPSIESVHDQADQFTSPDSNGRDSEGLSLSSKKM